MSDDNLYGSNDGCLFLIVFVLVPLFFVEELLEFSQKYNVGFVELCFGISMLIVVVPCIYIFYKFMDIFLDKMRSDD